jgi:hypothetical protein
MLRQAIEKMGNIPDELSQCFEKPRRLNSRPQLFDITSLLYLTLRRFKKAIFIVVDGLDELGEKGFELQRILRQQELTPARIMITSRYRSKLHSESADASLIDLALRPKDSLDHDMRLFIQAIISSHIIRLVGPDVESRKRIEEFILEHSMGSYVLLNFLYNLSLRTVHEV